MNTPLRAPLQGRVVLDAWRFPAWTSLRGREQGSLGSEAGCCSSPMYWVFLCRAQLALLGRQGGNARTCGPQDKHIAT